MGPNVDVLPVVSEDFLISTRLAPYEFLTRCKFKPLKTRQPMVELYLLAFSRFPLRKKEHKFWFDQNRTATKKSEVRAEERWEDP